VTNITNIIYNFNLNSSSQMPPQPLIEHRVIPSQQIIFNTKQKKHQTEMTSVHNKLSAPLVAKAALLTPQEDADQEERRRKRPNTSSNDFRKTPQKDRVNRIDYPLQTNHSSVPGTQNY
jgi:hypothetical protein